MTSDEFVAQFKRVAKRIKAWDADDEKRQAIYWGPKFSYFRASTLEDVITEVLSVSHVKVAIKSILAKCHEAEPLEGRGPVVACNLCDGSGYMSIFGGVVGYGDRATIFIGDATKHRGYRFVTSCICKAGERIAEARKGRGERIADISRRRVVAKWLVSLPHRAKERRYEDVYSFKCAILRGEEVWTPRNVQDRDIHRGKVVV